MAAVSDQEGKGTFIQPSHDPALVMTTPASDSALGDQCVYISLDDFCAEDDWTEPTIVKIDVQGFEPRVRTDV